MRPLRLRARNYRSFEQLDFEFPEGPAAIVGENGAGKSSIVGAVEIALFGGRLATYRRDDAPDDQDLWLDLEFDHAGRVYGVTRTYSAKGRGKTTLELRTTEQIDITPYGAHETMFARGGWLPLTREDQKETQALLEDGIGLTRETFRASAYLAQGDGAAFTEAPARDRKRILAEILQLDIWDRLLERAKAGNAAANEERQRLVGALEHVARELAPLADAPRILKTASQQVDALDANLAEADTKFQEASERLSADRERRARLDEIERVLGDARGELAEAERRHALTLSSLPAVAATSETDYAAAAELASAEAALVEAKAFELKRGELARVSRSHMLLTGEAETSADRARTLRAMAARAEKENEPVCDRCGQLLKDPAARKKTVRGLRDEADGHARFEKERRAGAKEAADRIAQLKRELSDIAPLSDAEAAVAKAKAAADRIRDQEKARDTRAALEADARHIMERIESLRPRIAELEGKLATLQADGPEENLDGVVARAYSEMATIRSELDQARQEAATAKAKDDRRRELEAARDVADQDLAETLRRIDLYETAIRAFGPAGVPALILENAAIPSIEAEADRLLEALGCPFRVELRTLRELRSREGRAESLDVVVVGPAGDERPYETFSGGERTRLNLALRIALARLLAHRRGAEVRMLAIDEPDGLDAEGFSALSQALLEMGDDFDSILVISHHPDLATAFDRTIRVEKNGTRSEVVA